MHTVVQSPCGLVSPALTSLIEARPALGPHCPFSAEDGDGFAIQSH